MIEVIIALSSVLLGFILGFVVEWGRGKRRLKVHWAALRSEINLCKKRAQDYVGGRVKAPLYRLPTVAFQISLPILMVDGDLSAKGFEALVEYYSWCLDINRGLDNADELRKDENLKLLEKEYRRNLDKAETLYNPKDAQPSRYEEAVKVLK